MKPHPADHEAAPYLTQALFLARTMTAAKTDILLNRKRERVFELVIRSDAPEVHAEYAGLGLNFALIGVASLCGTLPDRHRMPETVVLNAEARIASNTPSRRQAAQALTEFIAKHAVYEDPDQTEIDLRHEATKRRCVVNRAQRTL